MRGLVRGGGGCVVGIGSQAVVWRRSWRGLRRAVSLDEVESGQLPVCHPLDTRRLFL